MLTLTFAPYGPKRPPVPFVPPPGMRLQEYALAWDDGRKRTVYLCAHDHGPAFGDAYLFDGREWQQVRTGSIVFATSQKLCGFYDEARAGVAVWSFAQDFRRGGFTATSLLFDVKNGLSPIESRGEAPVVEPERGRLGTFDHLGVFAPDPRRAVTVCLTRRGVWELDADAVWRKRAGHDASFPIEWDDDGAGGAFDPVRRRATFWVYTRAPRREYAFFSWDGHTLVRLSAAGLPMKQLHVGLFDPAAVIGAHPVHGLMLVAGASGAFAFDGERWNALPAARGEPPPRMRNARMVYDGNVGGSVVGPGYHDGDPGGLDQQRVFYVEKDGVWTRLGTKAVQSRLKDLRPRARHAVARGAWTAVATGSLQTMRWTDRGFEEVTSKVDGAAALDGERVEAFVDAGGRPLVITQRGGVLELGERGAWKRERAASRPFGERTGFCAAWDAAQERLVAWDGSVKSRATNETLFYRDGAWRAAETPSPPPADPRGPDDPPVDFALAFDSALGRVVRFGMSDVATLDGETWTPHVPKRYASLGGARAWERLPVDDPRTSETLLVNLATGVVSRFGLGECAQVAKLELPEELLPVRKHDEPAHVAIAETVCFDPATRLLHAQDPGERWRRYAVDLGPAFDAAHGLRARPPGSKPPPSKPPPSKPPPSKPAQTKPVARLYHLGERVYWFLGGDAARAGALGEKGAAEGVRDPAAAVAAKRKAGFVRADELTLGELGDLVAHESRALEVGKKKKGVKPATSRVGGRPSGVGPGRWPKVGKRPLGFLFQIACRDVLRKHVGVAVFCATDGTATADPANNAAVLLTAADWKKKPGAAPKGVPVLDVRPITLVAARPEIDESRVRALGAADPVLAAAFERFRKQAKVQSRTTSKVGGAPVFLRSPERPDDYGFVAQIDFGGIANDWGLAGCVYVFVSPDEKEAAVFWQSV